MKNDDINQTIKSLVTEIVCKAYNDEIKITNAVAAIMSLVDESQFEVGVNKKRKNNVDPLFESGPLPIDGLGHYVIQEIKESNNETYMYFIRNIYDPNNSSWFNEDELIKKIRDKQSAK